MALDPTPAPGQAQSDDANDQQGGMAQEQQQQQQQQQNLSITRSITSIFSAESDELDATELKRYSGDRPGKTLQARHDQDGSDDDEGLQGGQATSNSHPHGDGDITTGSEAPDHKSSSEASSSTHLPKHIPSRFSIFWRNHISAVVHVKDARDHLALERTYLAYHRTAMVFAMLATATAQLTVINHAPKPSPSFGFYVLGKPLAVSLAGCALLSSIVGGFRWWRLQRGLLRGVAISGGREVLVISGLVGAIIVAFFGLIIAIDVEKEYK